MEISDCPTEVIEEYCDKCLSSLFPESTNSFREQITNQFMRELGTRILDAHNMLNDLDLSVGRHLSVENFISQRKKHLSVQRP